jgi:hypothetical protein
VTNRDFYLRIVELCRREADNPRELRDYLIALRSITRSWPPHEAIGLSTLAQALDQAFAAEPAAISATAAAASTGSAEWDERLTEQIRDLDDMRAAGTLDDEQRYFGIDSPRGGRWYNFTPAGFLECGATGAFGGWQEGDGGRALVPGKVVVFDKDGVMHSVDPEDVVQPITTPDVLTWDDLVDFLNCGQWYE